MSELKGEFSSVVTTEFAASHSEPKNIPIPEETPMLDTNLSLGSRINVDMEFQDIRFKVKDREILMGISGKFLAERTVAIMGSSGAGKTTFLNAVSKRLASSRKKTVSGQITVNGVPYTRKSRRMLAFVTQEDVLLHTDTPYSALHFSIRVRCGANRRVSRAKTNEVLEELRLTNSKNTIIGIPGLKVGISGGERKRTNIGVELITSPKVLLLDEPTSGLDSVTAATVCELLQQLARRGRTVVYTIHQPTSDCIQFFDDLMLMVAGQVVYHGTMADSISYFSSIGFECPQHYTPTDFFMTLMQDPVTGQVLIDKWTEFVEGLNGDYTRHPHLGLPAVDNRSMSREYLAQFRDRHAAWYIALYELLKRSSMNVLRNRAFIIASFAQSIIVSLFNGLIFLNLKNTTTGISDRLGLLFTIVANLSFGSTMSVVNNFSEERAVYIRDQQSGAYSPHLFLIAKIASELPLHMATLVLYVNLSYWLADLWRSTDTFFIFAGTCFMLHRVGTGIGLAIAVGIENTRLAAGMTPLIVIPFMLVCGFLISSDQLDPYWLWLKYTSYIRYAYVAIAKNEFKHLTDIKCDLDDQSQCKKQFTTGNQVLQAYGFNDRSSEYWVIYMALAIWIVVIRVLVWVLLRLVGRKKN